MAKPTFWPLVVVGIGALFVALTAWSIRRAVTGVSRVSDPGYYERGLRLDQDVTAAEAAQSRGWALEVSAKGGALRIRLVDGRGRPVSGAQAELTLPVPAGGKASLRLTETNLGEYATELPEGMKGPVAARLEVERAGARMTRALLLSP